MLSDACACGQCSPKALVTISCAFLSSVTASPALSKHNSWRPPGPDAMTSLDASRAWIERSFSLSVTTASTFGRTPTLVQALSVTLFPLAIVVPEVAKTISSDSLPIRALYVTSAVKIFSPFENDVSAISSAGVLGRMNMHSSFYPRGGAGRPGRQKLTRVCYMWHSSCAYHFSSLIYSVNTFRSISTISRRPINPRSMVVGTPL